MPLKAQAVASRSYAMYFMRVNANKSYDIIDESSEYQAMHVSKKNTISDKAVSDTYGEILTYNGQAANCCFCHANDGTQKSAKEIWGGTSFPYLPHQEDPWTKASGVKGDGHSVGMSQEGAKWAAGNGVSYKDILNFYYPGTTFSTKYNGIGGSSGGNSNTGFPADVDQSSKRTGYIATQTDPLTIRSGPGTSYARVGFAAKGSTVDCYTTTLSTEWLYIVQGSLRGYGHKNYISTTTSGSGYASWQAKYGNNTFVRSSTYSGNVERWQTDINKWYDAQSTKPTNVTRLSVDGKYGSNSISMCTAFQKSIGVSQTGYASPSDKPTLFDLFGR